jgi:hypothetical protein
MHRFKLPPIRKAPLHTLSGGFRIEVCRIKVATSPYLPFLVLFMGGVGDHFKKFFVSWNPTNIFEESSGVERCGLPDK